MAYIQVVFSARDIEIQEMLIAMLENIGYEGFEQTDEAMKAFIAETLFEENEIASLASQFQQEYQVVPIKDENWNKKWEENFQPVIVPGFCTVKADFHNLIVSTPHEIVINPKMSFGTGHHATTQLMMMEMKNVEFGGMKVLDFGTGTGILAILAAMLGAENVMAIDNDIWSYENALENVERNNLNNIDVKQETLDEVNQIFNIILANINRHILLQYMGDMRNMLKPDGTIIMSGLLEEDYDIIVDKAKQAGFVHPHKSILNGWISIKFRVG